ncbi:MAG: 16S rRNA (uracil(1498)-N(3))-methyltransferase [Chloroflexi bacterium]|nr:16S rRNA (uracil(1498)-N(3))-methyltransferase [Chloroflexota bacterium]
MPRFFVSPELLSSDSVDLTGPLAHQISHVLRLSPGDAITLLDDSGWEYQATLATVSGKQASARITGRTQPATEPRVRVSLFQALVTEQKLDWVLQKGTELGVAAFCPIVTERSLPARAGEAKLPRWRRIVTEAAEQSGRTRLPSVAAPRILSDCLPPPTGVLALLGAVGVEATPLPRVLAALAAPPAEVWLLIGPEGGFTAEEVALAREAGVQPIAVGPRILRTETAGLAAAAALMYALGEWN